VVVPSEFCTGTLWLERCWAGKDFYVMVKIEAIQKCKNVNSTCDKFLSVIYSLDRGTNNK
jgi:hypothetical protein